MLCAGAGQVASRLALWRVGDVGLWELWVEMQIGRVCGAKTRCSGRWKFTACCPL